MRIGFRRRLVGGSIADGVHLLDRHPLVIIGGVLTIPAHLVRDPFLGILGVAVFVFAVDTHTNKSPPRARRL
jgi:hypothetical protein